jgi:Chalcone isomerase-like
MTRQARRNCLCWLAAPVLATPWRVGAQSGASAAASTGAAAAAPPPELTASLPGIRLQGQGRLRFLGLRVYDAKLWAGAQAVADNWPDQAFALELDYARELPGKRIAERTLVEMKRQGDVADDVSARWLAWMTQQFPDVKAGDRLSAVNLPGTGLRLFFNGSLRGELADPLFAKTFFGVWLSARSSEPALRDALLGRGAS